MSHPLVVHCKKAKCDVYVGRPSKWGNPFVIGVDGARDEVIRKFKAYMEQMRPDLVKEARSELRDRVLGCHCAPLPCHADVLAEIANSE